MNDWKRVYSTPLQHLALMVEAALEDADFHPVIINKKDSNYLFGFFEIFVSPQEAYEAEVFISVNFTQNQDE
jgi:hypothetical protein